MLGKNRNWYPAAQRQDQETDARREAFLNRVSEFEKQTIPLIQVLKECTEYREVDGTHMEDDAPQIIESLGLTSLSLI